MIITLIKKEKIHSLYLPSVVKGQFWVIDESEQKKAQKLLSIEDNDGEWFIRSRRLIRIRDVYGEDVEFAKIIPASFYQITLPDSAAPALLFCEEVTQGRLNFNKYTIDTTKAVNINIGRSPENDIVVNNKMVSRLHCTLKYDQGCWKVKDNKSENGTFVNGFGVTSMKLKPGDTIYILGLTIIIGGKFIAVNNPGEYVTLDSRVFKPYQPKLVNIEVKKSISGKREEEMEYFYRSPRFKRELEKARISIDPPPQTVVGDEMPMILILGPSMTMGLGVVTMAVFTMNNAMNTGNFTFAIPSMVMASAMLLGTILWPILAKRYEKRNKLKKEGIRQEKYRAYLKEMEKNIALECIKQEEILRENYISVEECIKRVFEKDIRLWERGIDQNDFLRFRIGSGNDSLLCDIKVPEKKFFLDDDDLRDTLYALSDKPKQLIDVPITLSLKDNFFSSVIGQRDKCIDFAKGLIIQLTSLYGYDDVKTVFLYDETDSLKLEFTKWMPHVWSNDKSFRMIAKNMNELKEISAYLEREIEYRKSENRGGFTPYYVIFAFSRELALRAEMLKQLYALNQPINISVISFFDELKNVPKECTAVIELTENEGRVFDKNDTSGKSINFINDISYPNELREFGVKLANIFLDLSATSYQLPQMITFLEMFEVNKVEHLNTSLKWRENNPIKSLQTPVGVNTFGDVFYLDLHEKFHGPHGLVAGMTGSGKSEFIITYILSLALNYHPHEVSFILIDYKGGGMAKALETLPHVAGVITNLDGASIKRSLVSIESELKHRQALFNQASKKIGASNIDIYKYQKAYRDGLVGEPLSHLFIISDEFAELKTQQPEFMTQLVSTARIGRSLGVHLILATQKPSGVVDDQIWSNSKFKVCLKVQDRSDSMEMLKRPDAAELVDTGRFYLQVGYNELFEMGQSAWAGADYQPNISETTEKECAISVIDTNGYVLQSIKTQKGGREERNLKKQLDAIVDYLVKTAKEGSALARQLWLPIIEPIILLSDLHGKYKTEEKAIFKLNPLIGEIDDPIRQRRLPLYLPISEEGNSIIYGFSGSGKATFLTTMLYELLNNHDAESLNVYIMDFGAETLRMFEKAPQVGDVVFSGENEKIVNLLKMLKAEIVNRKKLFSKWGGDIASYWTNSGESIPNILVAINNYSALHEMVEESDDYISTLTQEGTKYGIYFVLTSNTTNGVRYNLLQNFKQIFAMQLNEDTDYVAVLGSVGGIYPSKIKGRGILKRDEVFEFQVAHIVEPSATGEVIRELCTSLAEAPDVKVAKAVPILPDRVTAEFFGNVQTNMKRIPVGVNKTNLNIEVQDLTTSFITIVSAIETSKTISFMQGLAELLSKNGEVDVTVLDGGGSFEPDANKTYEYVNQDFEEAVITMLNIAVERHNGFKRSGETVFSPVAYLLPALQELQGLLSEEGRLKLNDLLENGNSAYGISLIFSDSTFNLKNHALQEWYRRQCVGNGIWIGDGVTEQYELRISNPSSVLYGELGNAFGVIIKNGRFKIAKLLQSHIVSEEEMEDE